MKNRIKLSADEIKRITVFETLTGARVKDCVEEGNTIEFLIENGDMGLAIGKNGANITRARKTLGRTIIVTEFFDDENKFIKNLFSPINVKNVRIHNSVNNEKIAMIEVSKRDKGMVIGSSGIKIRMARKLAKRNFDIDDIKVRVI